MDTFQEFDFTLKNEVEAVRGAINMNAKRQMESKSRDFHVKSNFFLLNITL